MIILYSFLLACCAIWILRSCWPLEVARPLLANGCHGRPWKRVERRGESRGAVPHNPLAAFWRILCRDYQLKGA